MTLSGRFITAYNEIDDMIHEMSDLRPQAPFTEAVRTTALHNAVVKRYADDLYAYGRLRNAIVHSAKGSVVIAEPHEDVVVAMEEIASQLRRPIPAREVLGDRDVVCVSAKSPLQDAVRLIAKHRYSNIPVIEHRRVLGILTPKDIVMALGAKLSENGDLDQWLDGARVIDIPRNAKFAIVMASVSAIEAINAFDEDPKLRALILTDNGSSDGHVEDIVTSGDLTALSATVLHSVPV